MSERTIKPTVFWVHVTAWLGFLLCGCHRSEPGFQLANDRTPLGIVRQFTNLVVNGSAPDRLGAARALGVFSLEAWDPQSQSAAIDALLQACGSTDTNVQAKAFELICRVADSRYLPLWSQPVLTNCAQRALNSSLARVQCAAAALLLTQDPQNQTARTRLLTFLGSPEAAVRLQAGVTVLRQALQDGALKAELHSNLVAQASATNRAVRLHAVELLCGLAQREQAASRLRLDAENALVGLLKSPDVHERRLGASLTAQLRPTTVPLRTAAAEGLKDADLQVAVPLAFLANGGDYSPGPGEPAPGTLQVLSRALQDADPKVRLEALSRMGANQWWCAEKRTKGIGPDGVPFTHGEHASAHPLILGPLTNALSDPDGEVRMWAVSTISVLSELSLALSARSWQVATEGLASPDPECQVLALISGNNVWLAASRRTNSGAYPPRKFVELFQDALVSRNERVRRTALDPWRKLKAQGPVEKWIARCSDPDPSVRRDAGGCLAQLAKEQARATNRPWAKLPEGVQRLVADPFPEVALAGIGVLHSAATASNQAPVTLEARARLSEIASGADPYLKAQIARYYQRWSSGYLVYAAWYMADGHTLSYLMANTGFGYDAPSPAPHPEVERVLQRLALAPEAVVRRQAVLALNYVGGSLPPDVKNDPDPEVRRAATISFRRSASYLPAASETLESLLQKLRGSDTGKRLDAALRLCTRGDVWQKPALQGEVFKALLDTYTNSPAADFKEVNSRLLSLGWGPESAVRHQQLLKFAVGTISRDVPALRAGAWELLADVVGRNYYNSDPAMLSSLRFAVLTNAHSPDPALRLPAVRLLPPVLFALQQTAPADKASHTLIRQTLLHALSDPEPAVATSAAAALIAEATRSPGTPDRILADEALLGEATRTMRARLDDPLPDVRRTMAAALALVAARQSDTATAQKALAALEESVSPPGKREDPETRPVSLLDRPDLSPVVRDLAFRDTHSVIRQAAIKVLVRMIQGMAEESDANSGALNSLMAGTREVRATPDELAPLKALLQAILSGGNTTMKAGAAQLLSRIAPAGDTMPADLVADAHSADAARRQAAMLRLAASPQNLPSAFARQACALAGELAKDPDENVRAASLDVFIPVFYSLQNEKKQFDGTPPLLNALEDPSPKVQEKAWHVVANCVNVLPDAGLDRLAPVVFKGLRPATDRTRFYLIHLLPDLAHRVQDPQLRQRALLDVQEQINRADNDRLRADWLGALGELHLAFDQPNEAAAAFDRAVRLSPDNQDSSLRARLEKALMDANRRKEATLQPAQRQSFFEMSEQLNRLASAGDLAGLVRTAERALEAYAQAFGTSNPGHRGWGEHDQVIRETTRLLLAMNKFEALEGFITRARQRFPGSLDAGRSLGQLRVAQGRKEEALSVYEQHLRQAPEDAYSLEDLGKLCRELGKLDRYEALLRELALRQPAYQPVNYRLALCLRDEGRTNEALQVAAVFRDAVERMGPDPASPGLESVSYLFEESGDSKGAIATLQKAITEDTRPSTTSKERLARLYGQAGRTNEAFQVAGDSPKERERVLERKLEAAIDAGKTEEAVTTAREILGLDLPAAGKRAAWSTLQRQFSPFRPGNARGPDQLDLVVSLAEEAVKRNPQELEAWRCLAEIYETRSDWPKTIDCAARAVRIAPEDEAIFRMYVGALNQAGRSSESVKALYGFLSRNPLTDQSELLAKRYPVCVEFENFGRLVETIKTRVAHEQGMDRTHLLETIAYIHLYLGDAEGARNTLWSVRMQVGFDDSDRLILARLCQEAGKLDEAIELLRQSSSPGNEWSLNEPLREACLQKGMTNEAGDAADVYIRRSLERIKAGTADARTYNEVAWTYIQKRVRPQLALEYARKAASLAPETPAMRHTVALALVFNGDYAAALPEFVPYLDRDAEDFGGVTTSAGTAWKALTEIADHDVSPALFLDTTSSISNSIQANVPGLARLNLVLSHFYAHRGERAKAQAARLASGYPDERHWLFLGGFPNETNSGFGQAFIQETVTEVTTNLQQVTCRGPVRWQPGFDGLDSGTVDLDDSFDHPRWTTTYAFLRVESDSEQEALLRLRSASQVKLWVNGTESNGHATLPRGANAVLVKLCNQTEPARFSLNLTDPFGEPLAHVTY